MGARQYRVLGQPIDGAPRADRPDNRPRPSVIPGDVGGRCAEGAGRTAVCRTGRRTIRGALDSRECARSVRKLRRVGVQTRTVAVLVRGELRGGDRGADASAGACDEGDLAWKRYGHWLVSSGGSAALRPGE